MRSPRAAGTSCRSPSRTPTASSPASSGCSANQGAAGIDRAQMERQLRDRYTADFIGQWRAFLQATTVVRYANLKDAASKLT